MTTFEERVYIQPPFPEAHYILGADIGGTHSNFGIFTLQNDVLLLMLSLHTKSQKIKNFTAVIQDLLNHIDATYGIRLKKACFAIAGVIPEQKGSIKLTNVPFIINLDEVKLKTGIKQLATVNDFAVIGYGIDHIDPTAIITVKSGTPKLYANKAFIGAGTGLGKTIFFYNNAIKKYYFIPSEGGHADAVAQTKQDLELLQFIRKKETIKAISWEYILSGSGIKRLYAFHQTQANLPVDQNLTPKEIFEQREKNEIYKQVYRTFGMWYARAIKNFAFEALAQAGMYIAGGIAAKNQELFMQEWFLQELLNTRKKEIIQDMPLYLITDYNVSLYGAAFFASHP